MGPTKLVVEPGEHAGQKTTTTPRDMLVEARLRREDSSAVGNTRCACNGYHKPPRRGPALARCPCAWQKAMRRGSRRTRRHETECPYSARSTSFSHCDSYQRSAARYPLLWVWDPSTMGISTEQMSDPASTAPPRGISLEDAMPEVTQEECLNLRGAFQQLDSDRDGAPRAAGGAHLLSRNALHACAIRGAGRRLGLGRIRWAAHSCCCHRGARLLTTWAPPFCAAPQASCPGPR